jgi:hypothetical protein
MTAIAIKREVKKPAAPEGTRLQLRDQRSATKSDECDKNLAHGRMA